MNIHSITFNVHEFHNSTSLPVFVWLGEWLFKEKYMIESRLPQASQHLECDSPPTGGWLASLQAGPICPPKAPVCNCHLHWSMEWTTGYTIALFPALLCMELCVHGGEDWLFLDILCLQHAPHITMTAKYPLLAKELWSRGDMEPLHCSDSVCLNLFIASMVWSRFLKFTSVPVVCRCP